MKTRKEDTTHEIHDRYREILNLPEATDHEIEEIRRHFLLVAQAICEYLLGRDLD